jgi:hypothetical protein
MCPAPAPCPSTIRWLLLHFGLSLTSSATRSSCSLENLSRRVLHSAHSYIMRIFLVSILAFSSSVHHHRTSPYFNIPLQLVSHICDTCPHKPTQRPRNKSRLQQSSTSLISRLQHSCATHLALKPEPSPWTEYCTSLGHL